MLLKTTSVAISLVSNLSFCLKWGMRWCLGSRVWFDFKTKLIQEDDTCGDTGARFDSTLNQNQSKKVEFVRHTTEAGWSQPLAFLVQERSGRAGKA